MIIIGWTDEERHLLINAYENRIPIRTIKELDDKNNLSITRTAIKLGLAEKYPDFDYMVGQKFGYLTVISKVEPKKNPCGTNRILYNCLCDCGNYTIVDGTCLRSGSTRSCGCKKGELNSLDKKKYNEYDLSGEYGVGFDKDGKEFYFDLEDYDKIKDFRWDIDENGYVVSTDSKRNFRKVRMHRIILNLYPDNKHIKVDHIHSERKHDNRKINLRLATNSQNGMNMRMMPQNTSGVTGVSYKKDKGLWVAYITCNNKRMWLGSSKSFDYAVALRKEAEEKYFKERSYANSQAVDIGA